MDGILRTCMPKLFLIPNVLSEQSNAASLAHIALTIERVRVFFVEEPKSARKLLKAINPNFPLSECTYIDLNEHTLMADLEKSFDEFAAQDIGIVSEAGYPCVADPGSQLVRLMHQSGGQVIPLQGASAIILALASSGLNGQNFAFNGYLSRDRDDRIKRIRVLEQRSKNEGQTQILMDAPYRSQSLLEDLLATCQGPTQLCVACDITGTDQMIHTTTIAQWKKKGIILPKKPTLFLLLYN